MIPFNIFCSLIKFRFWIVCQTKRTSIKQIKLWMEIKKIKNKSYVSIHMKGPIYWMSSVSGEVRSRFRLLTSLETVKLIVSTDRIVRTDVPYFSLSRRQIIL